MVCGEFFLSELMLTKKILPVKKGAEKKIPEIRIYNFRSIGKPAEYAG